jgi:hypothetical protein
MGVAHRTSRRRDRIQTSGDRLIKPLRRCHRIRGGGSQHRELRRTESRREALHSIGKQELGNAQLLCSDDLLRQFEV